MMQNPLADKRTRNIVVGGGLILLAVWLFSKKPAELVVSDAGPDLIDETGGDGVPYYFSAYSPRGGNYTPPDSSAIWKSFTESIPSLDFYKGPLYDELFPLFGYASGVDPSSFVKLTDAVTFVQGTE